MKLKLHTVSPVHIGTGNHLEPFEYFIEDGVYYRLDQKKAFKIALESHPDFPDRFSTWIDKTATKLSTTINNTEQAKIRERFNFKYFCEYVLQDYDLLDKIKSNGYAYRCEVPFGLQNKKQVSELIKDANNNFYIPGTSIKGAIRTILAWRAYKIMGQEEKQKVNNKMLNSRGFQKPIAKELDDELIKEVFICGQKINSQVNFENNKYDILRFIRFSDAYPIYAKMSVYPTNLYLTDKKPQSSTPAVETIDFNSVFEFEISINEDEILTIYEKSVRGIDWIGMDKKFKRLFGFYPHEVPKNKMEEEIIASLKTTISDFSKNIFSREKRWTNDFQEEIIDRKRGRIQNANIDSVEEFYDVYDEIPSVFRIGWASGFTSTTIFDALENDEVGKEFLKKVFKRFKIGIPPKKKKDPNINLPNLSKFPKSRRLTAKSKKRPVEPFGWVALLYEDENLELE